MNELDFIEALSNREKTSGVKEMASSAIQYAKGKAPEIGAGLLGAGILGGYTYHQSKSVGGKPSRDQQLTSALLASSEARKDQAERDHRPISFREDMTDAIAPSAKNIADVFARHPVRGSVMIAPAGALAGLGILRALQFVKK